MVAGKRSWMLAPAVALAFAVLFVASWLSLPPEKVIRLYDNDGRAIVELMTLPLYALIIPLVWLASPFKGSAWRRFFLNLGVSLLAGIAILKETDLHIAILHWFYPETAQFKGTPFKMNFLRKTDYPLGAKAIVGGYFGTLFVIGGYAIIRYIKPLWKGFWSFHPVAWSVAFLGGSGVLVQIVDRLPSVIRKNGLIDAALMDKHTGSVAALFKVFEEGTEAALAIFALLAILQAHAIYRPENPPEEFSKL